MDIRVTERRFELLNIRQVEAEVIQLALEHYAVSDRPVPIPTRKLAEQLADHLRQAV